MHYLKLVGIIYIPEKYISGTCALHDVPNWGWKVAKCQNTNPQSLNILVKIFKKMHLCVCLFVCFSFLNEGIKVRVITVANESFCHTVQIHHFLPQIWAEQMNG